MSAGAYRDGGRTLRPAGIERRGVACSCVLALWLMGAAALGCDSGASPQQARGTPDELDAGLPSEIDDSDGDGGRDDEPNPAEPDASAPDPEERPAAVLPPLPPADEPLPSGVLGVCAFEPLEAVDTDNALCRDGTARGEFRIRDASDVDRLRGCQRVVGDVIVESLTVSTLAGLESLRVLEGTLDITEGECDGGCDGINDLLLTLSGLDHLRCIAEDLFLNYSVGATGLQDIGALRELIEVGGNVDIVIVSGQHVIPKLRRVWGDVYTSGNIEFPELEIIFGNWTGDAPKLHYVGCREVGERPCYQEVLGCGYRAVDQAALDRLEECVVVLRGLTISGAIDSLMPLRNLRDVAHLVVENNTALTNLAALSGMTRVRSASFWQNSALLDLTGLEGVTTLGSLWIRENEALLSLRGLAQTTDIGTLVVESNPNLATLRDLSALESVDSVSVRSNAVLPECEVDWLSSRIQRTLPDGVNGPAGECSP